VTQLRPLLPVAILAIAAAGVSAASGPNLGVALFTGAAAAFGAGVLVVLVIGDRVRRPSTPAPVIESEILVTLRDALSSGSIGRGRVIAAVQSVDWELGRSGPAVGADEERRLLELSAAQFRVWLTEQLDRLERET